MRLNFKLGALLLMTSFISACVPVLQTRQAIDPLSQWEQRRAALNELYQWQFDGRTVIRQENEAWNAGLHWRQDDARYEIKLSGPFSQGGVKLDGDTDQVSLTLDDGRTLTADTPETLMYEALQVNMPVSALKDWVRGLPYRNESIEHIEYDESGQIKEMLQGEWRVQYLRYIPFLSYSMPAKIFIDHPDISLRLVISDWDPIK
jgi:outer membrane lipoprotein LolB